MAKVLPFRKQLEPVVTPALSQEIINSKWETQKTLFKLFLLVEMGLIAGTAAFLAAFCLLIYVEEPVGGCLALFALFVNIGRLVWGYIDVACSFADPNVPEWPRPEPPKAA